jgi:hypothetical protein
MVNKRTRSRRNGSIKKKQGLKVVDINSVLDCKNKKYGCDLKAKRYTCYTHTKYKQNKRRADIIKFTIRKNGARKLRTPVLKAIDWFDCSHFK